MRNIDENKITVALDYLDRLDDPRPKNVDWWCNKLGDLMRTNMDAAVAILGYSLPFPSNMLGCPLGDEEFKGLGAAISCDKNAFAAAEKTGLIAEGMDAIFFDALNNCGSWSYHHNNIKFILSHDELRKYVSFSDRYIAERLLEGGEILCENDDLWMCYVDVVHEELRKRKLRGY